MKRALAIASLRGLRTAIQGLAGVATAVPIVNSIEDARVAGIVAMWGAVGAAIAGVAAFLQNFSEALEKVEAGEQV